MRASVLIPFRARNEHEERVSRYTLAVWTHDFPEFDVITGSGPQVPGTPFNRSLARNFLAGMSTSEVLIFADADTLYFEPSQMLRAVKTAHLGWFRTSDYYMFSEESTNAIVDGGDPELAIEKILFDPPGGIQVCAAEHFHAIGGFDEGFNGWGYEDTAFIEAMTAVYGEGRFHGDVYHLWHPKNRSERQAQPNIRSNQARFQGYQTAASGGREAMMEHLRKLERIT